MARVYLDVSVFGQGWFQEALPELVACGHVRFSLSRAKQMTGEIQRVRKLAELLGVMSRKNRVDLVRAEIGPAIQALENHPEWVNYAACDDPHIFALVYNLPTKYIFSQDHRLAQCRGYMNRFVDSRFCSFIVISDLSAYRSHRNLILR